MNGLLLSFLVLAFAALQAKTGESKFCPSNFQKLFPFCGTTGIGSCCSKVSLSLSFPYTVSYCYTFDVIAATEEKYLRLAV